jgi:hypothetical protein
MSEVTSVKLSPTAEYLKKTYECSVEHKKKTTKITTNKSLLEIDKNQNGLIDASEIPMLEELAFKYAVNKVEEKLEFIDDKVGVAFLNANNGSLFKKIAGKDNIMTADELKAYISSRNFIFDWSNRWFYIIFGN